MLRKIASKSFNAGLDFAVKALYPVLKKRIMLELEEDFRSFGVEDTNVCNGRCSFCAYRLNYDKRPKGFVEEKVLSHSLELFKKWGGSSSFSFISVLGDPLTDKDLIKKIKFIASEPSIKEINIYTNLIGLRDYDIEEFVKSGVNIMSVSICLGGREMYKRLFGVDEYDNVTGSLLRLLEINKKHGKSVNITLLLRMDYPAGQHYDKDLMKKLREYLPENKFDILPENMWDDYNGNVKKEEIPQGGVFRENIKDKVVPCYALYRKMQVLMNGDIAVCSCRVSPELVTDNIFNHKDLMDYWRGDKLKKFRDNWLNGKVPGICKGCNHYLPVSHTGIYMLRKKLRKFCSKFLPIG